MKLINENRILIDEIFKTKKEVLEKMGALFLKDGIINDYEVYLNSLLERENISPTAVGYSVGLPHGKSNVVNCPSVAFARLKEEILWDEEENEMVKYIFMLAIPDSEAGNQHINILVDLSKKILDDDFREKLSNETSKKKIMDTING